MDIASDVASQTKLKIKKMQEAAKKHTNLVVNDVMRQVALKKVLTPTADQVAAREAAAAVAAQINYNNIRKTIIDKINEHKEKVQQSMNKQAAAAAQRQEVKMARHEKFLAEERQRFEKRRERHNAIISESIKNGL